MWYVQHPPPIGVGDLAKLDLLNEAGTVHEHLNLAQVGLGAVDSVADRFRVGHIGGGGVAGHRLAGQVVVGDGMATRRQRRRHRCADPAGCPGHERHPLTQPGSPRIAGRR